jgi:N-acetylglucosamine-6-phosphate deacetylase
MLSREGELALEVSPELAPEENLYVSPGLLDIQVNGYKRLDYSSEHLSTQDVRRMVDMLGATGTTRHFPTVITAPTETILRNLELISSLCDSDRELAAAIPGIHVEGPFISPVDGPRGVHDPAYVRLPDYAEYEEWQAAAKGRIRLITLAPELEGSIDLIEKLIADNVIVALGHHAAEPEIIQRAVSAGASLSTHLGNGSHATIPRLHNYIWEQLANDSLMASIIADGYHLPPPVLRVFERSKSPERIILVSDVGPLGGLPPGIATWGPIEVEIHEDGHLGIPGTRFLAGAGHLLDRDVAQAVKHTDMTLADAVRSCSIIPSERFALDGGEPGGVPHPENCFLFRWDESHDHLEPVLTKFVNRVWKGVT